VDAPWDEASVRGLVDNAEEERQGLEFKGADALGQTPEKKKLITINVSAMANAAGGTIVFGIAEGDDHRAKEIQPIDPRLYSKEWLEQVIHSIEPRIPDVTIQPVPIMDGGGVVYVVDIPQGLTAHQARDHRYYRRYNFEKLPMLHHEIVDVMNRARTPELVLVVGHTAQQVESSRRDYELTLQVVNKAMVTAAHYKVEITFPHPAFGARADSIHADWPSHKHAIRGLLGRREEAELTTIIYRSQRPLYPRDSEDITEQVQLRYKIDADGWGIIAERDPDVVWTIYADNALPRSNRVKVSALQDE
jgi:hypothetical protein